MSATGWSSIGSVPRKIPSTHGIETMSVVIQFPKALGAWVTDGLGRGWPMATLILTLIEERMDPAVARAIVEAFAVARHAGLALPLEAVTVEQSMVLDFDESASSKEGPWANSIRVRLLDTTQ